MNSIDWIYFSAIGQTFGWTIFHSLWQFGIIAVLLRLGLSIIPQNKPNVRYWMLVSGMLFSFLVALQTFRIEWLRNMPLNQGGLSTTTSTSSQESFFMVIMADDLNQFDWSIESIKALMNPYMPVLGILWLVGVAVFIGMLLSGFFYLNYLKTNGLGELSKEWLQRFEILKAKMGVSQHVKLRTSTKVDSPVAFRMLKPIILIPIGLLSNLTPAQVEVLILHELAHIRRYDFGVNLLQSFIEIFFFYHPAMWWISGKIRAEREHCCDALVIKASQDKVLYAQTLTQIQAFHFSQKTKLIMAANARPSLLSKRIFRLFGKYDQQPSLAKSLLLIFLLLFSITLPAIFTQGFASSKALLSAVGEETTKKETNETVEIQNSTEAQDQMTFTLSTNPEAKDVANLFDEIDEYLDEEPNDIYLEETMDIIPFLVNDKALSSLAIPSLSKENPVLNVFGAFHSSNGIDYNLIHKYFKAAIQKAKENGYEAFQPKVILDGVVFSFAVLENNKAKFPAGVVDRIRWVSANPAIDETNLLNVELFSKNRKLGKKLFGLESRLTETFRDSVPLFVLDGKQITVNAVEGIDKFVKPEDILHISILKGESSIEKYGDKAKYGAVEIITKEKHTPKELYGIEKSEAVVKKAEASRIKLNTNEELNPLYVIDGKITGKEDKRLEDFDPNEIESVTVLKGESAKKAYGEQGANGVVEIITKANAQKSKPESATKKRPKSEKEIAEVAAPKIMVRPKSDTDPLYIIDGKEVKSKKLKMVDPKDIDHINVLKGEKATNKYGEKASNGVVEVFTKDYAKKMGIEASKKEKIEKVEQLEKEPAIDFDKLKEDLPGSPLFILDGKALDSENVSDLNQLDTKKIKSINVLKGPSAFALYGSRAADGAIIILTKGAKAEDLSKVNVTDITPLKDASVISGTISDVESKPLIGAIVKVVDSKVGTVTDLKGKFRLEIPTDDCVDLEVQYVGKATLKMKNICGITGKLNIVLGSEKPEKVDKIGKVGKVGKVAKVKEVQKAEKVAPLAAPSQNVDENAKKLEPKTSEKIKNMLTTEVRPGFGLKTFPNPSSDNVNFRFNLEDAASIALDIFDMKGRQVKTIFQGTLGQGEQQFTWNPATAERGTYIIKLNVNGEVTTSQFVLQ